MKLNKLKANALQYVLFISIVIAVILFSFILLVFLNKQYQSKAHVFQKLVLDTHKAFDYVKKQETLLKVDSLAIPSENELIHTKAYIKPWGIFNQVQIKRSFKRQHFQKTAFLGGFKNTKSALYLQETNKPLVLVGNTKIVGQAFLPMQGVKRGTIAGHYYEGSQLIYGNSLRSRSYLPKISNRKAIQQLCKGFLQRKIQPFILEKNITETNYFNPFTEVTKQYISNRIINLKDMRLSGNYIIQSDTLIQVYPSAKLKDVLLIAPYIEIKEKTTGNFQVFATKGIIVQKNCFLSYPTVLVLAEEGNTNTTNNNHKQNHQLQIDSQTEIKGSICFLTNDKNNNHKTQLTIQEQATIYGEVYCEKNMSLLGTVNGSVYTHSFMTNAYGSIYHNHLYNGQINVTNLSNKFTGLLFKNEEKQIVQWVY